MNDQEAKGKRTEAKRQFTRTTNVLNNTLTDGNILISTVNRRFADVKNRFGEAEKAHDAYIALITDPNIENEDKWIEELSETYYTAENKYDMYIDKRTEKPELGVKIERKPETHTTTTVNHNKDNIQIQIERLKFNKFEGDMRRYARFKKDFETYVQPRCEETQIPIVLKSYLSQDIIDDIESIGNNITNIWKRLDKRFGNEGRLVDVLLSDVKNIEYCNDENEETILHMIKTIERAYTDLTAINKTHEMNNTTIIAMIEEKMSEEMYKEWIAIITKENRGKGKFELLKDLLEEWRCRIEYKLANVRSGNESRGTANFARTQPAYYNQNQREGKENFEGRYRASSYDERGEGAGNRGRYNYNGRSNTFNGRDMVYNGSQRGEQVGSDRNSKYGSRNRCWVHKTNGDHPIWRCREFQRKTVQERKELVKLNNACERCLEVGHAGNNCTRGFTCTEQNCNEPHNRLLHETTEPHTNFFNHDRNNTNLPRQ